MLRLVSCLGYYMVSLSVIYLLQTILCYNMVRLADFEEEFERLDYAKEVYEYSIDIELMKIVHAITLVCVATFLILFTNRFKMLNENHYIAMVFLVTLVTIAYFVPVIYVGYTAYKTDGDKFNKYSSQSLKEDMKDWEKALLRFGDWFYMIIKRSDLGVFGLFFSFFVHLQIYVLLFIM